MKPVFESKLNVLLSELLNQIGVVSHSEYLDKGRKDVIIYHQGLAIVLEGSYQKQDAENDAKKRIEQLAADVALAVQYPVTFTQELTEGEIKERLQKTILPVRVIVPEDISGTLFKLLYEKNVLAKPLEDWYELDLNSLASLIQEIAQFIISEESIRKAEDDVSDLIQGFVTFLFAHKKSEAIAKNLYGILYKLYGFSIGEPSKIKEAIFAQATLAVLLSSIYYESIRYAHTLDSLEHLARVTNPQQAVEKATDDILVINYKPIFEAIKNMLKAFPPMPMLFNKLVRLASDIASKRALLRRDLAGKVYHRVVGDWSLRKGLATFFTQIPAAYLLLYLAKPRLSRIADFACGSGTLLVAAYSATNANYRMSLLKAGVDKHPKEIETEFHTQFISSCHAFDVLEYATQITALNLALHSPETPIQELSNIYTMPLGYREEDDSVSLGSLELARVKGRFDQIFRQVTKTGLKRKEKEFMSKLLELEPFDFIVMNPPFARTTGRSGREGSGLFGFIGEEKARQKVLADYNGVREEARDSLKNTAWQLLKQAKLEFLLKDEEFRPYENIWQAGEGLLFLYLADNRIRKDGKLCFVLPRGLLSGSSWFLARVLLAAKYHVQYIVVSYEAGNYNFSESTSLSECLIVAHRTEDHFDNEETSFVLLLKKPRTSIEAIALAKRIGAKEEDYVESGESKAFLTSVKRTELLKNLDNWGRFVSLPNLDILREVNHLLAGNLKLGNLKAKIPLKRLNDLISSIGVDRHRFTDTFQVINDSVPGAVKMLHGGEEAQRKRMATSHNAYALPMIERGKGLFQEIAGNLLVPNRIWVDTAHVISMLSDDKLISNIFYVVRLQDENLNKLKALCLWLNTTWGILTVLASREETRGGFISLNQSHWRLLPVLDIDSLSKDKIKGLAALFDEFKDKELARIPEQYGSKGEVDKQRVQLDHAFLKIMGIDADESTLLSLYSQIGSSLVQWMGA
jgi:type I restriction-modification system DNA methylase subunit